MSDSVIRLNVALQGRYAIERELGEGGMATVYLADDLKHERKVDPPGPLASRLRGRRGDRRLYPVGVRDWRGSGMKRRVLIGSLLVLVGCGGDDPTGPTPMVITTSLPDAGQNVEYSETLTATGGDGNYEWSVLVGTTPTGLSLNASTGEISGTPTVVETQHFTVQVETRQQTAQQALSIAVGLRQVLQPSDLCSDPYAYAIATFEDANLEAAVRALLSVGAQEDLTCGLLDNLTGLMADSAGIESLVGIQNLTSLTNLNLDGNPISDISPLGALTGLTNLWLGTNSITDISALSGLTSLTGLILTDTSITDISPLSGLTSLTELYLNGNTISDISALSGLTSLMELYVGFNSITDVSGLSGLTGLTTLYLQGNVALTDIGALTGLTGLTYLDLRNSSITDISALSGFTSLTNLQLGANSITDISALSGLTSLPTLNLQLNSITDISALSGLVSLRTLQLGGNSITDISPLSGIPRLNGLWLDNNSISDISVLSGLTRLVHLQLERNPNLSNMQPLLDNTGLGEGDRVFLRNTNVSCTDVTALRAKGVTVDSACP